MIKTIKERKQRNAGITLIALVVTIIVLLILAGITINLTIGEDGIITRAKQAGENYIAAQENEKIQLGLFTNQMDDIIDSSTNSGRIPYNSEFRNEVVLAINREGVDTLETDTDEIIISNIGKIFQEKTKISSELAATADNITVGKQAYVNGELVIGNGNNNEFNFECNTYTNGINDTYELEIGKFYILSASTGTSGNTISVSDAGEAIVKKTWNGSQHNGRFCHSWIYIFKATQSSITLSSGNAYGTVVLIKID